MPTSPTPIAALPDVPTRADPANFAAKGDAFLAALPTFRAETNAAAVNVYANAVEAEADAAAADAARIAAQAAQTSAAASAVTAAQAAGAPLWVSGTTYALGDAVYSPATFLTYRRAVAGAGTTDPSADPTNWRLAALAAPLLAVELDAAFDAQVNGHHAMSGALAQTAALPAAPQPGDTTWLSVCNGRADNAFDSGSTKVNGAAAGTYVVSDRYARLALTYINATYGWSA